MKMIMAIVQAEDVARVTRALVEAGHRVTQISTTGGWLRRDNATLLLGVEDERVDEAIGVFKTTSKRRETDAAVAPASTAAQKGKIVVGGATIFLLNVDQFERF